MAVALRQSDVAFGNPTVNLGAIRQAERLRSLGPETNGLPDLFRQQRVGGAAIHEKANLGFLAPGAGDRAFDMRDSHLGIPLSRFIIATAIGHGFGSSLISILRNLRTPANQTCKTM